MNDATRGTYRFGPFELDASAHALRRRGKRVHLQPKAFETLHLLVSKAGQVVSKDTLLEQVWSGQVVSDNALTRAIREVRRALDDSATEPRFVETVPRVGYRFRAPVEHGIAGAGDPGAEGAGTADAGRHETHRFAVAGLAGVAALVVLVAALAWWLGTQRGSAPAGPAVVAFEGLANTTGDAEAAYLGEGIVEGVSRRLGSSGSVRVLRLPPVPNADALARRFDADWRLAGSLRLLRGQTVVEAELIRAGGAPAWRREFPLVEGDAVAVQQALAAAVADTLGVELGPLPAYLALAADTQRIRAHRLYLTGRGHLALRRPAEVVRAVELFEQALELMPDHAAAMASLGIAYILGPDQRFPPETARQRAATLFERALEVDAATALAYAGQGLLAIDAGAAGPETTELFEKALALDPNDADALVWYATLLGSEGRIRQAVELQQRALDLEPSNPSVTGNLAFNLARLGRGDEARALLEPVTEDGLTEPMLYYQRISLLSWEGRLVEAFDLAAEATLRYPRAPFYLGTLSNLYWQLGRRDLAVAWVERLEQVAPGNPFVLGGLLHLARLTDDEALLDNLLARVAGFPGVDPDVAGTLPEPLQVPVALAQLARGRNDLAIGILARRHADPEAFQGTQGDLAMPADEVQWLALALRRAGQPEQAAAWLDAVERAIAARHAEGVVDFTPLMLVEARNLAMLGRDEAALAELERLLGRGWKEADALAEDPRWGALAEQAPFRRMVSAAREATAQALGRVLAAHPPEALEAAWREALAGPGAAPGSAQGAGVEPVAGPDADDGG